jgi:predicted type IV restriction endonuclease
LSERQIAEEKVKPYLRKTGFSEDLISDYDVVLVQFGTTTGRVDFVCYHLRGDRKLPFLVVEVKTPEEDLDPLQAESYAQRLDAPFFAVTNGDEWVTKGKGQVRGVIFYKDLKPANIPWDKVKFITKFYKSDLRQAYLPLDEEITGELITRL